MLAGQPLAGNPLLQEILEGMGEVGFFLLCFPGWVGTVEQVSLASVALLSKFTQYPRATSHKLPQEQRHQAKHAMSPAVTGRVIGFHQFSKLFWGWIFAYS